MKYNLVSLDKVMNQNRIDFDFWCPLTRASLDASHHYTQTPLSELCIKISTGKTAPKLDYTTSGTRIIKVKNVQGIGIDWEPKFYVTNEFYEKSKKAHIQKDDILMMCTAHNKSYIGRCDIIDKNIEESIMCVGELIIIRVDSTKILPDYLLAYLRLETTQNQIQWMVTGQTAHLYPKDLGNLKIVVPPIVVQRQIASIGSIAEKTYAQKLKGAKDELLESKNKILKLIMEEAI